MTQDRVIPADHMQGIFLGATVYKSSQHGGTPSPLDPKSHRTSQKIISRPRTARVHGSVSSNHDGRFMTSDVTTISISETPIQQNHGLFSCNRLMNRPGTKSIQSTVLREIHHSVSPLQSKQLSPTLQSNESSSSVFENGTDADSPRTRSSMSEASNRSMRGHKEKSREILLKKIRERHAFENASPANSNDKIERNIFSSATNSSRNLTESISSPLRQNSPRHRELNVTIPTENSSPVTKPKLKRPRSTPYHVTSMDSGVEVHSQLDESIIQTESLRQTRSTSFSPNNNECSSRSYHHFPTPPAKSDLSSARKSPDRPSPHSSTTNTMSSVRAWVSSTGPATIREETQRRIMHHNYNEYDDHNGQGNDDDDDDDTSDRVIGKPNVDNNNIVIDNDDDSVFSSSGTENMLTPSSIGVRSDNKNHNDNKNYIDPRTTFEYRQPDSPKMQRNSSNSLHTNPNYTRNHQSNIITPTAQNPKTKTRSTNSDSSSTTTIINVISPENEIQTQNGVDDPNPSSYHHYENDEMDDEPGYLDSYSDAIPLQTQRRGSLWSKLRLLGPSSLRDRATTPSERSRGTMMSGFRSKSSTMGSSASSEIGGGGGGGGAKGGGGGARCPNCGEKLQPAAPSRYIVVKGNEKSFLGWILSKWAGRKELQKHGNPGEQRSNGYMPHYCNFVRTKAIHDRPKGGLESSSDDLLLDRDDEDVDDGYITNTELSSSNLNSAASRKKQVKSKASSASKKTKSDKDDDDTDGVSEAILRAVSPTVSTGYDPESLFERLREHGLAGSNSALNDSNVEDDLLGSPHVNFDLDDVIEKGSSHDVTTQTSNIDTLLSRSSTPAREPIQIPSIDENSHDIPVSTTSDNVKANASLVSKLIDESKASEVSKSKRAPCVKKDKMPGKDKRKKGKKKAKTEEVADAALPPEITQVSEEANKSSPAEDSVVPQVDVNIPDLPTVSTPSKGGAKTGKRKTKKTIGAPTKKAEKIEPPQVETKPETGRFYDFGDLSSFVTSSMEDRTLGKPTVKVPSYLNDRMVLSLQSSRFELPMDMKSLEKMSPQEYLKKHCVVSTRRKTLYQKIFTKYREKAGWMHGKHLMRCLKDVLVNTITTEQVEELYRLLDVENESQIDFKFFCGIAALAERILYPQFLTEDTADVTEYQKERVEVADFCSLEWKLNGVQVSSNIKQLLETIS